MLQKFFSSFCIYRRLSAFSFLVLSKYKGIHSNGRIKRNEPAEIHLVLEAKFRGDSLVRPILVNSVSGILTKLEKNRK